MKRVEIPSEGKDILSQDLGVLPPREGSWARKSLPSGRKTFAPSGDDIETNGERKAKGKQVGFPTQQSESWGKQAPREIHVKVTHKHDVRHTVSVSFDDLFDADDVEDLAWEMYENDEIDDDELDDILDDLY